jgi:MFS family permease
MAPGLTRTSKQLITYLVLSELSTYVFMGIYIFYLQANGLSYLEMTLVFAANFLTLALCDLPTGNLADKHGRKRSIVAGTLIFAYGLFIYALTSSFLLFMTAEIVLGIGSALLSGSLEAWYVDDLKRQGKASEAERVFGLSSGVASLVGVTGGLVSSVLTVYALGLPILFGAFICLAAALFALLTFRENYGDSQAKYVEIIKRTVSHFRGSRALRLLTLAELLRVCCIIVYIFIYQPFMVAAGLPAAALGTMFAAMTATLAAGSFLSARLIPRMGNSKVVFASMIFLLAPMATLPFLGDVWSAGTLFLLCSFGNGLACPAAIIWRNVLIPSGIRASGISVISTVTNVANAGLSLAMGLMIESWGVGSAFLLGLTAGAGCLPLFLMADKETKKVPNQMSGSATVNAK